MIVKIQNRRGEYLDYDPSKLLPGEFAVVQMGDPNTPTGKAVYLAITAGDVVRLATVEEIEAYTQQFDDIYQSTIQDAQQILDNAKSLVSNYSGGLIVVSSTSAMTDHSKLYLYTGSGQYHNYVYAYDSSQSQFTPFFDYGVITQVGESVAKNTYTTVLSATTYNDKATALAALDSYVNNIGGQMHVVGYISTANSNLLGLSNTSHYMDYYVNSASYRLLVARPVNGSTIYQLAKQNGTWGTSWQQLAKQSDLQSLSALLQARQYGAISAMYTELISLLAVNQGVWCTATGNLIASLTNSEITKVCRVIVIKADTSVLDYMLFAPGSNAIYIGRINSTSSITNRNRFALRSDVAGVFWESDSAVKITTSITSNVASHANGVYYLWSTASDATAVGAPSAHAYHYLIVKVNSSAAIIQAHRMTTDGDEFYIKQLYGGNWASAWTQIANQSDIDTINSTLTTLTGTQASTTPTGTDLNTLTDTGIYQIGDLSQMTNGPTATGYGSLEVIKSRTYVLQRFVHMSATAASTEYFRVSVDGGATWRSWHVAQTAAITASTTSFASYATTYISNYTLTVYKIGRMAFIQGFLTLTATPAPAETQLATLSAAFKPITEWTLLGEITSGTSANQARNMLINTSGTLIIHNQALPASTYLRFSGAYITAS